VKNSENLVHQFGTSELLCLLLPSNARHKKLKKTNSAQEAASRIRKAKECIELNGVHGRRTGSSQWKQKVCITDSHMSRRRCKQNVSFSSNLQHVNRRREINSL
jgi:hypothetical protein